MLGLFKNKTPDELLFEHIKKVHKKISRGKGGCIQVCMDFMTCTTENDLYKSIGFFMSSELKNTQAEVMYSAVILLALLKTGKINHDEELVLQLAETTFVLSSLIIDESEIKSVLLMIDTPLIEKREALLEKHRSAWREWSTIHPSLLTKIAFL